MSSSSKSNFPSPPFVPAQLALGQNIGMASSSSLSECYKGLLELQRAMNTIDESGLYLVQTLSHVLKDSPYGYVGNALATKMVDVYSCAKSKAGLDILGEMGAMLTKLQELENQQQLDPHTYHHTLCHVSLLLIKLKRQYYSLCETKVADLVHSLLCLKGEEPAAGEVTKLVLKLGLADGLESPAKSNSSLPSTPWGSPKSRSKARPDTSGKSQSRPGFRIMSLFERKTPTEERSSFYVDVEEEHWGNRPSAAGGDESASHAPAASLSSDGKSMMTANNTPSPSTRNKADLSQPQPSINLSMPPPNLPTNSFNLPKLTTTPSVDVEVDPSSKLASEEDLDSIINLLSGMGGTSDSLSPMQAIPEVPPRHPPPLHSPGGPIQLVVPQIYRLPSPASDTQVDELRSPSRQQQQPHRRSEGCLDLSAMRPSPQHHHHHHQQQQHHHQQQYYHHPNHPIINTNQPPPPLGPPNSNLPWVHVQSVSSLHSSIGSHSHGSISECPSPISGYGAGDSSPGYTMSSPSPSYPASPARLPMNPGGGSGNNSSINSLGVVGQMAGMRGRSLSPFQHWGGVGGGSGGSGGGGNVFSSGGAGGVGGGGPGNLGGANTMGGSVSPRMALTPEFGTRKQGTWPMYGNSGSQRTMGWPGIQDGSDLSDDSSTEDQFFAVGKDLCHALDSKGGSSDEEVDPNQPGQAQSSSTWPLPQGHPGGPVGANRGLTPDLLEPPDPYPAHRPVQMQWSDPMSSRSMWPSGSLDPSQRKTSQSMYGFGGMQ